MKKWVSILCTVLNTAVNGLLSIKFSYDFVRKQEAMCVVCCHLSNIDASTFPTIIISTGMYFLKSVTFDAVMPQYIA
jgi:hypothetical protein